MQMAALPQLRLRSVSQLYLLQLQLQEQSLVMEELQRLLFQATEEQVFMVEREHLRYLRELFHIRFLMQMAAQPQRLPR